MAPVPLLGEASCLAAALCWALAVAKFRPLIARHGATAVNLGKNLIASVLLGLSALALGQAGALFEMAPGDLALLAGSGLLGLTLGDTALFAAVHRLGVYRALLLQTLAPVFAWVLAMGLYGERLGLRTTLGGILVLVGVATVLRTSQAEAPEDNRATHSTSRPFQHRHAGLVLALLAAFGQGAGVVLSKAGMADVPVMSASFVRLAAGAAGLLLVLWLRGRLRHVLGTLGQAPTLLPLVPPTLLGTYTAFLLAMLGIAMAPASVAAVLLSTVPVFSLFIEARDGKPIRAWAVVGTVVSVLGVALLSA